jgi:adenylate cyclase
VQSEISKEIAEKLRLRLSTGEQQQLAKRETANPAAYELLLKGRFYWNKGGPGNQKKAAEFYNQATAVDPNYALAYAQLSNSYIFLVTASILDPKEFTPKAEGAAKKALELDEGLADAHFALANLKTITWDWVAAEPEYKRAIELNPNLAEAHFWYCVYLSLTRRPEPAIAEIKRARELDPLSLFISAQIGWALFNAHQYDQAIEALKKVLELDQNFPDAHIYLGYSYAGKRQYAEAIAAYQEAIRLGVDDPSVQISLGVAYAQSGERGKAQVILKRLQTGEQYVSPGELAKLHAALGEREQAFASLEKAYAMHDIQLGFLGVDPEYDSLRSDPRFADLVRRVGLPE